MINYLGIPGWAIFLIIVIALFDGVMKIIGMWKAARAEQLAWFICLAIFNTAGILPLVYLGWFQKKKGRK